MDPVRAILAHGGAARWSQLRDVGVTRGQLHRALVTGRISRPYRGCYASRHAADHVALAAYFDARVTCTSAAAVLGLRTLESSSKVHLEVDADRGGHRDSAPHAGAHLHRLHSYTRGDRVVNAARAIDVATYCVKPIAQLVMVDSALASGMLSIPQVMQFDLTPAPVVQWLMRHADARAESVPETCARLALVRAGLAPVPQAPIGGGRRVDLLLDGHIVVEIDGYEFHSDRRAFGADRARDRELAARGFTVLRFTYADAVLRPHELVSDVRAVLARGR